MKRALNQAKEKVEVCKDGSKRYHVIFLDKNHPPNAISRALDDIDAGVGNGGGACQIRRLYFVPKLNEANQFGSYPFSVNFLSQVLSWGQNRKDHETLNADNPCNMVEV